MSEKLALFSCFILVAIFATTNGLNATVTLSKRILNGENQDSTLFQVIADENATHITLYDALVEAQNKSSSFIFTGTDHPVWGFFIESIGGLASDYNQSLYWFVYIVDGNCDRSLETGVSLTPISDNQHYIFWYKQWVSVDNTVNVTLSKWIEDDKLNNDTIEVHLIKNDTCQELTLYDALKLAANGNHNYTFTTKNSDSEIESLGGLNESQTDSLYWQINVLYEDGVKPVENGLLRSLETGEKYVFWYSHVHRETDSALNRLNHNSLVFTLFLTFLLSIALNYLLYIKDFFQ